MANPQLEDGYVKIANEIYDALIRTRVPGEARQVLDVIIRKTYGFNKKEDAIALSQFCSMTGLKKPKVIKAIRKLESMFIIIPQKGNDNGNIYRINKDFSSWVPLPKKVTFPKKVTTVPQKGKASFPKKGPTKDNSTKDNVTKDNKSEVIFLKKWGEDSVEFILAESLYREILGFNPGFRPPNLQRWADEVDRMIRIDRRDPKQIEALIYWVVRDSFWRGNILSTTKLREKFDQLWIKASSQVLKNNIVSV